MPGPCTCGVSAQIGREAGLRNACYPIHGNVPERTRRGTVFTVDPSLRRTQGGHSEVEIPYEPLRPGPVGALFAVDALDFATALARGRVDLERPGQRTALDQGDPETHCRMVYVTAMATYETFRRALGRPVAWAFWTEERAPPLSLAPFAFSGLNAWYDRAGERIQFGYARFGDTSGRADSNLLRFTALSSDVVVHEVTHALIDGLRPGYDMPVHPDVLAFHEAFADVVALLSRFERSAYLGVLLRESGHRLIGGPTLTSLAPELGSAMRRLGLRTLDVAADTAGSGPGPAIYADAPDEPHARGGLLSSATFEAFLSVLDRRIEPLLRLAAATGGAAERFLQEQVEDIAGKTAGHFLAICIRALDYCPPAAIRFADYLRALITADRILVRSDPLGYRDEIIDAFRRRGIYPADVDVVSEGELAWGPPECRVYPIPGLALSELRFDRSPAIPLNAREIRRQARALALAVADDPRLFRELGLQRAGDDQLAEPEVISIRPTLRTGPDGYIDLSVIAEIAQERRVPIEGGDVLLRGGGTLILDSSGSPTFVVRQRVDNIARQQEELAFARQAIRSGMLVSDDGTWRLGLAARRALC